MAKKKVAKKKVSKKKVVRKKRIDTNGPLTYRRELFSQAYATSEHAGNGAQSAIDAGYTQDPESAKVTASRLLTNVNVVARIEQLKRERLERLKITGDSIMAEVAKIAYANMADLVDENGDLIPLNKLPRDIAASVKEVKHRVVQSLGDSDVMDITYKVSDKKSALELLMKEAGMLKERVVVDADDGFETAVAKRIADRMLKAGK